MMSRSFICSRLPYWISPLEALLMSKRKCKESSQKVYWGVKSHRLHRRSFMLENVSSVTPFHHVSWYYNVSSELRDWLLRRKADWEVPENVLRLILVWLSLAQVSCGPCIDMVLNLFIVQDFCSNHVPLIFHNETDVIPFLLVSWGLLGTPTANPTFSIDQVLIMEPLIKNKKKLFN